MREPKIMTLEEVRAWAAVRSKSVHLAGCVLASLCATVEHWHAALIHRQSIVVATETAARTAIAEREEELRLLRAFEAAAGGTSAESTSSQLLAACRERDRAWTELCAFRARQKGATA